MTTSNFKAVMRHVYRNEGGYVDHPRDPGGATNYGITHHTLSSWRGRKVTKQDVKNLTIAEADRIYRKNYWKPCGGDYLPDGLDLVAMDGSVNSGVSRGVKWVQSALKVYPDGKPGPKTYAAANKKDTKRVIKDACAARLGFLQRLSHWSTFKRGWTRRVAEVEAAALVMAGAGKRYLQAEIDAATKAKGDKDKSATVVGGGGAVTPVLDMPDPLMYAVLGVAVVAVVLLVMRSGVHGNRVRALKSALFKV